MSGQKGRSGGKRLRAGRFPQAFHLHKDRARELAILTGQKQTLQPNITEQQVLEELIYNAWYDLDQYYQEKAEAH